MLEGRLRRVYVFAAATYGPSLLRYERKCDNELKLESARPGVISNAHLFKSQQIGQKPTKISSVNTKQQSRPKYSHSLMSISLPLPMCTTRESSSVTTVPLCGTGSPGSPQEVHLSETLAGG